MQVQYERGLGKLEIKIQLSIIDEEAWNQVVSISKLYLRNRALAVARYCSSTLSNSIVKTLYYRVISFLYHNMFVYKLVNTYLARAKRTCNRILRKTVSYK